MRKMRMNLSHLVLPLSVMLLLVVINLVKGADYFHALLFQRKNGGRLILSGRRRTHPEREDFQRDEDGAEV